MTISIIIAVIDFLQYFAYCKKV